MNASSSSSLHVAALGFEPLAPHGGEHVGGLLAAHDGDPGVGPHPQEARGIAAAAHAVVAGAEGAADHDGEFGDVGGGDGGDDLGAVLGDAACFVFLADHEAGDVLQEDERNAALAPVSMKCAPFSALSENRMPLLAIMPTG